MKSHCQTWVKGFRHTDAKGEEQWFRPDAGWSYNPGKAAFAPDRGKYDADLAAKYRAAPTALTAYEIARAGGKNEGWLK